MIDVKDTSRETVNLLFDSFKYRYNHKINKTCGKSLLKTNAVWFQVQNTNWKCIIRTSLHKSAIITMLSNNTQPKISNILLSTEDSNIVH